MRVGGQEFDRGYEITIYDFNGKWVEDERISSKRN